LFVKVEVDLELETAYPGGGAKSSQSNMSTNQINNGINGCQYFIVMYLSMLKMLTHRDGGLEIR